MNRRVLPILCVLLAGAAPAWPQQMEWKDLSPHAVKFVTADNEVELEVLDWGGSGFLKKTDELLEKLVSHGDRLDLWSLPAAEREARLRRHFARLVHADRSSSAL